tara:strand:+ start:300 stop:755 length:456 start_codon:yes stop_codon:yes gene_type:complete
MIQYENPWIYENEIFDSNLIKDYYGFVYLITGQTTGRRYIGRKYFWQKRKPRTGSKRRVTSESDWKKYYGSCPELKDDIKKYGKLDYKRQILSLHETKGFVNFEETKQLFLNNVLSEALDDGKPLYYNSNILGRYMRKDYGNFRSNTQNNT